MPGSHFWQETLTPFLGQTHFRLTLALNNCSQFIKSQLTVNRFEGGGRSFFSKSAQLDDEIYDTSSELATIQQKNKEKKLYFFLVGPGKQQHLLLLLLGQIRKH